MRTKLYLLPILLWANICAAQAVLTGYVVEGKNATPLRGALITIVKAKQSSQSGADGSFSFTSPPQQGEIKVSLQGYASQVLPYQLPLKNPVTIILHEKVQEIEEVTLSTGYQKVAKERATGSFSVVSKKVLDQQVSPFILDKLVASANGITASNGTSDGDAQLMVRGLSTIRGPKSPLIVLDNFPYDGDIKNINPNTIESITVLKDAAAASIWGARAANGVIVLTTKKGKFKEALSVELNSSLSVSQKPDLSRIPMMSSASFIDVEQQLFSRGFYDADLTSYDHVVVSPVVALLDKQRNGLISDEEVRQQLNFLKGIDVRDQYKKYMYVPAVNRQYALNLSAGSERLSWTGSLGYDNNTGNLDEKYSRLNIRLQNSWKPLENLTVSTGVWLTKTDSRSGRYGYGSVTIRNNGLPYMRFADDNGNALPVFKTYNQDYKMSLGGGKLLDWNYYPLTNWQHERSSAKNNEVIFNAGINYRIIRDLSIDLQYQYRQNTQDAEAINDEESYAARDYINLFTQIDGNAVTYIVPKGAIYSTSTGTSVVNNLRSQLNYNKKWGLHEVNGVAGAEIRDITNSYRSNRYYGYNPKTLSFANVDYNTWYPTITDSWSAIYSGAALTGTTTRFVSLYANAAYTLAGKYTLSGSIRRDASNLFGVKTNELWNPFWSVGASWALSKENFYQWTTLPELRLRGSYGFNGNIDPAMVAATTISIFGTSPYTQTPMAMFSNYFNPNLKWETIRIINMGLDFGSANNTISGSVEYYSKKGDQLFGYKPMDYTTGITSLLWNVAGMKGNGWDFSVNSHNLRQAFRWDTRFNLSINHDQVTQYYLSTTFGNQFVSSSVPVSGLEGKPVYSIFAYRFAGLDPKTGDPLGYLNGEISKDYTAITGTGTDVKDLQYFGSAVPTVFGNMSHTFGVGNWNMDVAISYKLGYYFRRPSINYTRLYTDWAGHSDYDLRWKNPGDELRTNIPSATYETNSARDEFYAGSSALIEKGDHIRLQYINLSYNLTGQVLPKINLRSAQVYANLSNLGILWKATSANIDPDYNMAAVNLVPPLTMTLGFRANF